MTNNWTDMGNATCVVVMGANPVENHPASLAHINKARRGPHTWTDGSGNSFTSNKAAAKLIVVDPRQTRTARQADQYVRIRPGTDIAFINGVVNYIINNISGQAKTNWEAFLNSQASRTFSDDAGVDVAVTDASKYTDARFVVNGTGADYQRSTRTVGAQTIANFPEFAATYNASGVDTVFNRLAAHVAPYTQAVVADICGCTQQEIADVANAFMANSRCSSYDPAAPTTIINEPKSQYYRSTTMLYAMGLTQHTYGSQNVKSFAVLQTLMGNMGRPGGGINALRGIHNVQGSTDMGLLQHLIPGYSGNPSKMPYGNFQSGAGVDANAFGKYMDSLYGVRLSGGTAAYDNAYDQSKQGLQQAGFYNMTRKWFGDTSLTTRQQIDDIYALWPKVNGDDHLTMFRKMETGAITAAVVWGQNPAVTEPNQSHVRGGLENLDLLVVVDMFANETAQCKRKAGSVTYLIPSAAHVEEAGSVTNSGRVLQWRERARLPKGNSKSDLELLLLFAKAISDNGGFSHIKNVWTTRLSWSSSIDVYDKLYGTQYGWDGVSDFYSASGSAEVWRVGSASPATTTVNGCEWVAEQLYREMCTQVNHATLTARGTMWIYTVGYTPGSVGTGQGGDWLVLNRAKSRGRSDNDASAGGHLLYKNWGYAWLVNRRVLYNNGDTPWDQADGFQGPDQCARLFVSTNANVIDYSKNYRTIHRLSDKPDTCLTAVTAPHVLPGRFPAHTEPYETPRQDLATTWGRNTRGGAQWDLVPQTGTATVIAGRDVAASGFPLVLTTIRCVEHFQGGPITRNNPWNVEAEPEPWIEINPVDARTYGINNGDLVNVITARSNSTSDEIGRTMAGYDAGQFGIGFRARVDNGIAAYQRVAPGVVAIPWHWGDRGLSQGSRANDLTIDAGDANTTIPEYKACLCTLQRIG